MSLKLSSSVFTEGEMIPSKYTCDGEDVSPPLAWEGAPEKAVSFALIADDPDAPAGTWVHWVLYDLPPGQTTLSEALPPQKVLPGGGRQGTNDFHRLGYGGPCPPGGTHRYYFRLYALDVLLDKGPGLTKAQLLKAMEGHVLDEAVLMGRYKH